MFTLYHMPGTIGLAVTIALEEAGLPYRIERVDFRQKAQRSPDYLRINPKGRVPALATERGILTETVAILDFIARTAPEARLLPLDDAFAAAEITAFNTYLASTVHPARAHGSRPERWVEADDVEAARAMKAFVPKGLAAAVRPIEDGFLKGPWVGGEAFSIADGYLFRIARWLEGDGVPLVSVPRIADHMRRMEERAAVKRALAHETI